MRSTTASEYSRSYCRLAGRGQAARPALREIMPLAIRHRDVLALGVGVGLGVFVHDEAAGCGARDNAASSRASHRESRSSQKPSASAYASGSAAGSSPRPTVRR